MSSKATGYGRLCGVAGLLLGFIAQPASAAVQQTDERYPLGPEAADRMFVASPQGGSAWAALPSQDQWASLPGQDETSGLADSDNPVSPESGAQSEADAEQVAGAGEEDGTVAASPEEPRVTTGGWLATGYHNKSLPLSRARGDGRSFQDVPGSIELNQAWAFVERKASPEGDLADWGFRLDGVYGTDAQKTQAFGGGGWDNNFDNGVYGWAIPQLYGELAWGDTSVKVGHFLTPAGYEAVPSQPNFFYTRSLTSFNSEPFTHTGVLLAHELRNGLTVQGGWVAGWDTGFETAFNGNMFIGGLTAELSERATLNWVSTAGNSGLRGSDAWSQSVVLDLKLSEKINYVAASDLLRVNETFDDDLSLVQYLFYELNPRWKLGSRAEWWKDDGVSFWEWTSGINFTPAERLRIRTEVRHDVGPTTYDLTSFGIDAILSF